jgi:hypothetical protein
MYAIRGRTKALRGLKAEKAHVKYGREMNFTCE